MTPSELKEKGLRHFRAEQLPEAVAAFTAAREQFAAEGDQASAAEMQNNLCVIYMAQEQWAEAIASVEATPALFRTLGDTLREAQSIANLAAAHDGAGHVDVAADLYVKAIDLFGQLGERDTRAACFKKLSNLQVKQGNKLQALASMRSGLNLSTELTAQEKILKEAVDKATKLMGGNFPL
ncbi:MAG: tetratricopeptide repeat protein [Anaerolineales bacterium]